VGGGVTLTYLWLRKNRNTTDDEGVAVLVDALQNNTSLKLLDLRRNEGISKLLKLVNNIFGVKGTLQSNQLLHHYLSLPHRGIE
jgi:hypothetical protein